MSKQYLSQEEMNEIARKKDALEGDLVLSVKEMETFQEQSSRILHLALHALTESTGANVSLGEVESDWLSYGEMLAFMDTGKMVTFMELLKPVSGHNILAVSMAEAEAISNLVMSGDETVSAEEHEKSSINAYEDLAEKMASILADALKDTWGGEIKMNAVRTQPWDLRQEGYMEAFMTDGRVCVLRCPFSIEGKIEGVVAQIYSARLVKDMAGLWIQTGQVDQNPKEEKEIRVERPVFPPLVEREEKSQARNLDLIMDVPLEFSVVLGRTKKTIKEVLSLGTGSIVSLNKLADEPLEILVNGKLIAHGEVVVINENFGIRITNILSREKRVQGLK